MKVNEISIQNFRAIEDEIYRFNEEFTVLIGDNGTGKTSILDALAFSLGTVFLGISEVNTISIKESDKRKSMVSPNSIEIKTPLKIAVNHTFLDIKYNWNRVAANAKGATTTYKEANDLIDHVKRVSEEVRQGEKINLPLIAYYGVGRLNDDVFERKKSKRTGSRFEGYKNSLTPRTMQPKALEWMKDATTSSLQQFSDEEQEVDNALLAAFTKTIETLIPDWTEVRYHIKRDEIIGKVSDDNWQYLSMLSSGYKAIAKLAMDIAYRAVTLNPHLKEDAVLETSGVVLIDEIDMHLHPNWQKQVVNNLKNAFPKIQFIVTTHSPFIVQSLKADEIINLDGIQLSEDPFVVSLEENAKFMGVQSIKSLEFEGKEEIAYNYIELLKGEQTDSVKEQLDALIAKTTDPVFKAKLQLERLNKFGK